MLERAQGCLLGQLAGDALGILVNFQSLNEIRQSFPDDVQEMADGCAWNSIADQTTDGFEMVLLLARILMKTSSFDPAGQLRNINAANGLVQE